MVRKRDVYNTYFCDGAVLGKNKFQGVAIYMWVMAHEVCYWEIIGVEAVNEIRG